MGKVYNFWLRDLDQLLGAQEEITTLQAYFLPSFSRFGTQGGLQQYFIGFSYHHLEDEVILWGRSIVRNPDIIRVHRRKGKRGNRLRENEGVVAVHICNQLY